LGEVFAALCGDPDVTNLLEVRSQPDQRRPVDWRTRSGGSVAGGSRETDPSMTTDKGTQLRPPDC